ncbi:MAG: zf-HC2 domain-containing protein [Myxococcales bacterium]|nr:zf-HC2 domain-containing protein [Myxococcales bacterium]
MTVSCEQATRWTDAWIDGELDPSAALLVEDHLAGCACCRAEADMIRKLKRGLGALREDCAPTALRFRITAALDACEREQESERAAVARKKHARNFALAGAALAGVVLANGIKLRTGAPSGPMTTAGMLPVVEDIAERHARELPVEVTNSDPAAVTQWFRGKMDIPVRPVMFRGMTARLVGARISNVQNQMAAALTYDVDGRRMTVFVFDNARMPRIAGSTATVHGRPTYTTSAHGYTVTFTEQQGIGYAIASDLPPQECARIVAHAEMR